MTTIRTSFIAAALTVFAAPVLAQSAPPLSGQTFILSDQIASARAEAANTAAIGEQRRLFEAAQEERERLLNTPPPTMQIAAGDVALSLPVGSGLVPGAPNGAVSVGNSFTYFLNLQSGSDNVASNEVLEQAIEQIVLENSVEDNSED